ncbi:MAG: SGNH/GDSL hydrolase family protein, partial [Armatimonadota bacterium]
MTRGQTVAFRLAALALAALVAFGVAEVGVRIVSPQRTAPALYAYDARVGSIPVPNQRGRVTLPGVYSYSYANDALGLRLTGIVVRDTARARILVLGDSFAYGVGVNNHETFAYLLEQRLSQAGLSAAVMNAGNGGKGTDYALRFFETIGQELKPALTLLFFFANDYVD